MFALDDPAAVDRGLDGMKAVLHCAVPSRARRRRWRTRCLRAHVHYLDILQLSPSRACEEADASKWRQTSPAAASRGHDETVSDGLVISRIGETFLLNACPVDHVSCAQHFMQIFGFIRFDAPCLRESPRISAGIRREGGETKPATCHRLHTAQSVWKANARCARCANHPPS